MRALPLFFSVAAAAFAQTSNTANPVMLQADAAFTQALAKSDASALTKILDADLRWTTASGKTFTRTELLAGTLPTPIAVTTRDEKGNLAETKAFTYSDLGDVQINLGRAHALHVWAKRGNEWKLIVYQEVLSRAAPPTATPGAGADCENPCK